jgi:hypothetical protein
MPEVAPELCGTVAEAIAGSRLGAQLPSLFRIPSAA